MPEDLDRPDVEALLETRRELGPTYDSALVDSFADRIEKAVQARVAQQTGQQSPPASLPGQLPIVPNALAVERERAARATSTRQFVLGIVSCVAGIPISAITATGGADGSATKLAIAWIGIVGVNVAHALVGRRDRG